MDVRLFSIEQIPRTVPVWDAILADLGAPPPERVARALGVGRSTVYRWNAQQQAPRVAVLALFWLTRWGRSTVHTQATNDAILTAQLARSLSEDRDKLRSQVADLEHSLSAVHRSFALFTRNAAAAPSTAQLAPPADPMAWPMLALPELPELPELPQIEPARLGSGSPATSENGVRVSLVGTETSPEGKPEYAAMARANSGAGPQTAAAPAQIDADAFAALPDPRDARAGTPPSASLASLRFHGGSRPHPPAWQEPGAPPGPGVFAALATACTAQPTQTRRSRTTP